VHHLAVLERTPPVQFIEDVEILERRYREENERHRTATAEMRAELHALLQRGETAGISVSSIAKALSISRGRLNRMLDDLR